MLIGLMMILDEFEDGLSGTPLRAIRAHTPKNLVNAISPLRINVTIAIYRMLIGLSRPQISS